MIKITMGDGFKIELDENVFDDFELVELYAKVAKNPIWIGDLAEKLLGAEQKRALIEHLRDDNGKVHTTAVMNALKEIEEAIPAVKN
jgi:hypothetical protein